MAITDGKQTTLPSPQMFDEDARQITGIIQKIDGAKGESIEKLQAMMAGVLKDLLEYSVFHFRSQEKLMRSIHYEGYDDHASMHQEFVRRLREHMTTYLAGRRIEASLLAFLREWVAGHVAMADSRLAEVAREQGAPASGS